MSPLAVMRRLFHGTGRHRAEPSFPPTDESPELLDEQALAEAIEDGDIEANDFAFCGAEQRETFHAIHTDGSRTCWTCGTTTAGDQ
ncbi:hypothetical protein [Streptomyces sp. Je 1-369]|uniref:hypothetical protein n=1 Tax=Streptomyces sp. Je 1-369 TaxID=2966192 RepID=UPI0022868736|nr:hypothetical protein [Streptomyces sp. Je 1-369]WAL93936.1 hypothetical protein NOO62_05155 [Streptomyces sp. Je 1-369]